MTKARRIFEATYTECRLHIKSWGMNRNPDGTAIGFNGLITEEVTCRRTWNEIQKLIDSEKKNLEFDRRLNVLTEDRISFLEFALEMVQTTLNNEIKRAA